MKKDNFSKRYSLRLSPIEYETLNKLAEKNAVTRAAFVRDLITRKNITIHA